MKRREAPGSGADRLCLLGCLPPRKRSCIGALIVWLLVAGSPGLALGVRSAGSTEGNHTSGSRSLVWKDTLNEDIEQFNGANLFVSQCRTDRGRKLVLLEPFSRQGMLIEEEAGRVANSAELVVSAYGVSYVEVQGGIASNLRMDRLLPEMMKLPFYWFAASELSSISKAEPERRCALVFAE
jgi:hypothetical protein